MADNPEPLIMEEVTDPEELAASRARHARFDRNAAWFQAHVAEVYTRYRGTCLCVAGAELFVAETPEEVLTLARTAHLEDGGFFPHDLPRAKLARI
jgi:hypothetical protein